MSETKDPHFVLDSGDTVGSIFSVIDGAIEKMAGSDALKGVIRWEKFLGLWH